MFAASRPRAPPLRSASPAAAAASCCELIDVQAIRGRIAEVARDRGGSRALQQKLDMGCSDADLQLIFEEVLGDRDELMLHMWGNYVVQKLFEHGSPQHVQILSEGLRNNVLQLTLSPYGCRVVYNALHVIYNDYRQMIVDELTGYVLRCAQDENGHLVIEKCIECMPDLHFIVEAFLGNVPALAMHRYGSLVMRRLLEFSRRSPCVANIVSEVLEAFERLVGDCYGSYALQRAIINGEPQVRATILSRLRGNTYLLARGKFSHYVVQKMFMYGDPMQRMEIIHELITTPADDGVTSALLAMAQDQYATYVVRSMLDVSDAQQRAEIVDHIRPHINTLRNSSSSYGEHVIAQLERGGTLHGFYGAVFPPPADMQLRGLGGGLGRRLLRESIRAARELLAAIDADKRKAACRLTAAAKPEDSKQLRAAREELGAQGAAGAGGELAAARAECAALRQQLAWAEGERDDALAHAGEGAPELLAEALAEHQRSTARAQELAAEKARSDSRAEEAERRAARLEDDLQKMRTEHQIVADQYTALRDQVNDAARELCRAFRAPPEFFESWLEMTAHIEQLGWAGLPPAMRGLHDTSLKVDVLTAPDRAQVTVQKLPEQSLGFFIEDDGSLRIPPDGTCVLTGLLPDGRYELESVNGWLLRFDEEGKIDDDIYDEMYAAMRTNPAFMRLSFRRIRTADPGESNPGESNPREYDPYASDSGC